MSESQYEGASSPLKAGETQGHVTHKAYKTFDAFMNKVYSLMGLGLFISFITAMAVAYLMPGLAVNGVVLMIAIFVELALVIAITRKLGDINGAENASRLFYAYSVVSGMSFAVIFMAFAPTAIGAALFSTAGIFAAMSAYGTLAKKNLTGAAKYLMMILVGIIIASIVNIFIMNNMLNFYISVAIVVLFTILTAMDTQKLKLIYQQYEGSQDNLAVYGALTLYLDFINIFLSLLRIFGGSSNNN